MSFYDEKGDVYEDGLLQKESRLPEPSAMANGSGSSLGASMRLHRKPDMSPPCWLLLTLVGVQ